MDTKCCIYFFRDKKGEILYIGKTSSFKKRMAQHFNKTEIEAEGNEWKSTIDKQSIQIFPTNNATDLDIYETYFINKYKPKYNKDKVYDCTPSFDLPYIEPISTHYVKKNNIPSFKDAVDLINARHRRKNSDLDEGIKYCKKLYPIINEAMETIGFSGIDALDYNIKKVKSAIDYHKKKHIVEKQLRQLFPKGRYMASDVKEIIQNVYNNLGFEKKAKATDIESVFCIKHINTRIHGKPTRVYIIP
ncbi:MAG: GIY-YIG nuclease family protein [Cytophagales bacterium]|nr:GIY-YIG nuclease family protein [Cytophagales bacterium]